MKIAYIGYDLSCTKSTRYFQQQGYEVTYFLKEKKQNFNFKPFSAIDLFIDHVMIPGRSDQRTARQKQLFKKVTNEFTELKLNLNPFQSAPLEILPDVASVSKGWLLVKTSLTSLAITSELPKRLNSFFLIK